MGFGVASLFVQYVSACKLITTDSVVLGYLGLFNNIVPVRHIMPQKTLFRLIMCSGEVQKLFVENHETTLCNA